MRSRFKQLLWVAPAELRANPKNFRTHPPEQQAAFDEILAIVGMVDALRAYRDNEGRLTLFDGHLRLQKAAGEELLAVAEFDLAEGEANVILATHDPLAEMAETDPAKADALSREVVEAADLADDSALRRMLAVAEQLATKEQDAGGGDAAPRASSGGMNSLRFLGFDVPLSQEYADLMASDIEQWSEANESPDEWGEAFVKAFLAKQVAP